MSAPQEEPEPDQAAAQGNAMSVEDRGPFSHAVCRVCGWSGPGRRSRGRARSDADDHVEKDCSRG